MAMSDPRTRKVQFSVKPALLRSCLIIMNSQTLMKIYLNGLTANMLDHGLDNYSFSKRLDTPERIKMFKTIMQLEY